MRTRMRLFVLMAMAFAVIALPAAPASADAACHQNVGPVWFGEDAYVGHTSACVAVLADTGWVSAYPAAEVEASPGDGDGRQYGGEVYGVHCVGQVCLDHSTGVAVQGSQVSPHAWVCYWDQTGQHCL